MHADPTDIDSHLIEPLRPHVIVLFGATGDLARRKLLPGLFHLYRAGLLPDSRILGVAVEDYDTDRFRAHVRGALDEFARNGVPDDLWQTFSERLYYLDLDAGADALGGAVADLENMLGSNVARLHYLSVPPSAATTAVQLLDKAEI